MKQILNRYALVILAACLTAVPVLVPAVAQGSPEAPKQKSTASDSSQQIADRIVKSDIPVLLEFWASWCMPCRIMKPILKDIESSYSGRILVERVDVDVHRGLASYFKVSSIPVIYLIEGQSVVKVIRGVRSKEDIEKAIDKVLSSDSSSSEASSAEDTGDSQ